MNSRALRSWTPLSDAPRRQNLAIRGQIMLANDPLPQLRKPYRIMDLPFRI